MARVLLFGRLQDVAGWRERDLDPVPPRAVRAARAARRRGPALGEALACALRSPSC